jgi:cytochrome c-type protein NapC
VRTNCSDCHVPKEWHHKAMRKIYATNELFHKILGTVDTPEKFNAKRPEMIRSAWHSMRDANSRECRNCHTYAGMALDSQDHFAKRKHERAMKKNETCIDCHQGIAHKLPDGWKDIWNQEFEPVEASESPDPAQPDATQG